MRRRIGAQHQLLQHSVQNMVHSHTTTLHRAQTQLQALTQLLVLEQTTHPVVAVDELFSEAASQSNC
jgi:hypothetical protein